MSKLLHDLTPGTIITFSGKQWMILDQKPDGTTYVILNSNDGNRAFDPNNTHWFNPADSNNIGYYLNNDFYNSLSQKDLIGDHSWEIKFQDGSGSQANVNCKIALISYAEYNTYRSLFPTSGTGYSWWTRTPYSGHAYFVWLVDSTGSLFSNYAYYSLGVSPALYLKSGIMVSDTNEVIGIITNKYLFKDGNDIKKYSEGIWSTIGTSPVTEEMFNIHGMTDLLIITDSILRQLTSPELLVYTTDALQKQIKLTQIPQPKLILASGDINLASIQNIDSITITLTESGNGKVRLIVSPNSGVTWYTFNDTDFIEIDITNLTNVAINGMTISTFNSIPSSKWNSLLLINRKVRFGYYLEIDSSTDIANTDLLVAQFDMMGTWYMADYGTDYTYAYVGKDSIEVKLFINGDFKINYAL